jgi:hypothetical protein
MNIFNNRRDNNNGGEQQHQRKFSELSNLYSKQSIAVAGI